MNDLHQGSLWVTEDNPHIVNYIDQRYLPFKVVTEQTTDYKAVVGAIKEMAVRGAPLIGIASAWALYLGARAAQGQVNFFEKLEALAGEILHARPTAVNPRYTLERCMKAARLHTDAESAIGALFQTAVQLREEDMESCRMIGVNGLEFIRRKWEKCRPEPVQILTHCNAGWLACIRYGTALSPVYQAHEQGIALHVWVDETRPRNQGSRLTAWELQQAGIPFTVIADNVGGHLMQQGMVDMVIVGADRIAMNGDTANKTGTYLKALAANDNEIPFYVAAPLLSFDRQLAKGVGSITIEKRLAEEVLSAEGWLDKSLKRVRLCPEGSEAANYGFDITPSRLVTAFITEKGNVQPRHIKSLF